MKHKSHRRSQRIRQPFGADENGRFHRRGHGPRRGGRDLSEGPRRRRLFDSDALRLIILGLIAEKPRHGYDLIRAFEERSGGAYAPSPGMIYPLLTLLEEMELIATAETDGSTRKRFELTPSGSAELANRKVEIDALFARLDALAETASRTDPTPVKRAMHNLRNVLIAKLQQDNANEETIFAAVALIDGAAQSIERL